MKTHPSIGDVLSAVNRLLERENESRRGARTLRLSAAGHCARKLAYGKHFPHLARPLSARALSVFALGDVLHDEERKLIRKVARLRDEEREVYFKVRTDHGRPEWVKGHIDGVIDLADGPAIIDIKTMSGKGFEELRRTGVSYEYKAQLNAYMEASGIRRAYLWAYNKDKSERTVVPVAYDPDLVEQIRRRFIAVMDSTPNALPEREQAPVAEVRKGEPTGREYLPWRCGYCDWVAACWEGQGFHQVVEGGKPRWIRDGTEVTDTSHHDAMMPPE